MMIYLLIFLPLVAAVLSGLSNKQVPEYFSQYFNTALISIAAIASCFVFFDVVVLSNTYHLKLFEWMNFASFKVSWSMYVDSLTAVMFCVVLIVSALVHLYSIGYMSHDENIAKFMTYISLFTFFMLMLVCSSNLLQLFFGWEGVGLCSYLLIGFWYKKPSAYNAAIKAFVVNRISDMFFIIGLFFVYQVFNTFQFNEIFANSNILVEHKTSLFSMEFMSANLICFFLFVGCMGKSAQIILHTWLPDAMEGPTPVSALIHAATMVTAGVFLLARFSYVFDYSDYILSFITFIGATTALFAALIASTQDDIKKIIAYSTCSQLGYMFFACGVSAYSTAMFHLMTHAFFKALLFLSAGSVIHAMSDIQDIHKMGGLAKKIPLTFAVTLVGSIAIAGIPPFSGYFSKDAILEAAYASEGVFSKYSYICGVLAAFLTAFYSWRLLIIVFHGENKASLKIQKAIHESPLVMTVPLILLSVCSILVGFIFANILGILDSDLSFWGDALSSKKQSMLLSDMHHIKSLPQYLPLVLSLAGVGLAYYSYLFNGSLLVKANKKLSVIYSVIKNKFYFDESYDTVFVKPYNAISSLLANIVEIKIIDLYGPIGASRVAKMLSSLVIRVQSGLVYHYAMIMLIGIFSIISFILLVY